MLDCWNVAVGTGNITKAKSSAELILCKVIVNFRVVTRLLSKLLVAGLTREPVLYVILSRR